MYEVLLVRASILGKMLDISVIWRSEGIPPHENAGDDNCTNHNDNNKNRNHIRINYNNDKDKAIATAVM